MTEILIGADDVLRSMKRVAGGAFTADDVSNIQLAYDNFQSMRTANEWNSKEEPAYRFAVTASEMGVMPDMLYEKLDAGFKNIIRGDTTGLDDLNAYFRLVARKELENLANGPVSSF